jgi:glycine/serine hydroxymethyltransferase
MKENEMKIIGKLIGKVVKNINNESAIKDVKRIRNNSLQQNEIIPYTQNRPPLE